MAQQGGAGRGGGRGPPVQAGGGRGGGGRGGGPQQAGGTDPAPAAITFTKDPVMEDKRPRKIKSVRFSTMSAHEIMKSAEVQVSERSLYQLPERKPTPFGVLDPRLGTTSKKGECTTCNGTLQDCAGHFGYIRLELPVYHMGYFKVILLIMQCICKNCGRILLSDEERRQWLKKFRHPRVEVLQKKAMVKRVSERCKRTRMCHYCGDHNGTVKKLTGTLKLSHDKYGKDMDAKDDVVRRMEAAVEANKEIAQHSSKVADDLNPVRVLWLMERMLDEDCELLDLYYRPERLIVTHLSVPPVAIRPSVVMESAAGSNEDDATMKLAVIIEVNSALRLGIQKGLPMPNLVENWDFLQLQVGLYINSELPGLPLAAQPTKPTRGFVQRLKGKQGRFRQNLSGKRVDFSGRTVISPDPNLKISEVAVPMHMAQLLTFPEAVSRHNIHKLRQLVINGTAKYPGANFVLYPNGNKCSSPLAGTAAPVFKPGLQLQSPCRDCSSSPLAGIAAPVPLPGLQLQSPCRDFSSSLLAGTAAPVPCYTAKRFLKFLKYGDRRRVAAELKYGDIVERHLEDGDMVLFNRQPSLHRMSIMCHRARVMPWKTLRFNESVCNPYNADFDGDEMNMHVPQTEEARTEALLLMGVENNLCTPKNGEILVASTQDFLTSAFLITRRDTFYDRASFCLLCSYMTDGAMQVDIPTPALLKPVELWTGKQLIGVLVRPSAHDRVFVTLGVPEKTYTKKGGPFCVNDGFVFFRNSELLSGQLGKATLGNGSKQGLFALLMREYSAQVAAVCMNRLAKLSARWIGNHGFSIGIDDVQPSKHLYNEKQRAVEEGYDASLQHIQAFNEGRLTLQPGCNAAQTLEANITGELNRIREEAGKVCLRELHWRNSPLIMSQCGSKGSPINISQMVACVGQQSVGGKRAPNGFLHRSLPHFPRHDRSPQAKGFVANSFYSGLTPTEFVFHTMGGREGLVDTAVKTAETGYMSRRLMKALEDLSVAYDGTVRNASGGIVQMRYGDDGMDPAHMEGSDGGALNLDRTFTTCQALRPMRSDPPLFPDEMRAHMQTRFAAPEFADPESEGGCSTRFRDSVLGFLDKQLGAIEGTRRRLGLPVTKEETERGVEDAMEVDGKAGKEGVETEEGNGEGKGDGKVEGEGKGEGQEEAEGEGEGKKERVLERGVAEKVARNLCGITAKQLQLFLDTCIRRYQSKRMEPGTAVGAIGAQSIGEPGTQMTLKTFHFAGVASMNVTLGVPRIKEIINAAKNISTPIVTVKLETDNDVKAARIVKGRIEKTTLGEVSRIVRCAVTRLKRPIVTVKLETDNDVKAARIVKGRIEKTTLGEVSRIVRCAVTRLKRPIVTVKLETDNDVKAARIVKGRIEKTTLGEVVKSMKTVLTPSQAMLSIRLDMHRISALQLDITAYTVADAITTASRLRMKLKAQHIRVVSADKLLVYSPEQDRRQLLFSLHSLRKKLPQVMVKGIASVERAVINDLGGGKYNLLVEGTNFGAVLGITGVDGCKTKSNHVMEVESVLGIEAARYAIMHEINYTMGSHGMTIDPRHMMLLADVMTYKGEVLGITRFGIAKMKDSVLMLASFEKTTDHLFDAAVHGRKDEIEGVSECIIMGIPMPVGTGLFKLKQKVDHIPVLPKRPPLLLG
ncbi:unnamed protein product [Closterium sp. NIES-65]|nr:unnamed protein product [Closterium sp. NIES-65]